MQTSDQGRAQLKAEEGEVLKAYRDVTGVWTIGVGLTAKSGVVTPGPGMVITREQSDLLLRRSLAGRYEPAVETAMTITEGTVTRPAQHEFDAGVLFHFNTGAIAKASWVRLWKAPHSGWSDIRAALTAWCKGGGKVLPSLKARREREFDLLAFGTYRNDLVDPAPHPVWANWGLALSPAEQMSVTDAFDRLGYLPGNQARPARDAVEAFQRDHGLTVDGIIGRATLSTLQRALDARAKAAAPTIAVIAAPTAVATGTLPSPAEIPHSGAIAVAFAGLWLAAHAWSYRDIVAVALAPRLPRVAAFLRSF